MPINSKMQYPLTRCASKNFSGSTSQFEQNEKKYKKFNFNTIVHTQLYNFVVVIVVLVVVNEWHEISKLAMRE